jgi:hypothetical protein
MKSKRKRVKYIYEDLYSINIWFFDGWTREGMKKWLKKNWDIEIQLYDGDGDTGGSVTSFKTFKKGEGNVTAYCLYLSDKNDNSVVAHEAFHIVSMVLRDRGIPLIKETEEAYAYLLKWIIEKIV